MRDRTRKTALAVGGFLVAAAVVAVILYGRGTGPAPPTAESDAEESALLAASHGLVWRDGAGLHLLVKTGEELVLSDHQQCGDLPCAPVLATRYRYAGWDARIGGYLLQVSMGRTQAMVLTYGDDEPALLDARHAADADAPQPIPESRPVATKTDDSLAEWLAGLESDREQSESPLRAKWPEQASRQGGSLTLSLADRRHLQLVDDLVCGQLACPPQISRSFDFAGESPDGRFHIVQQEWNEAEEGLLVDRTGDVLETLSVPSFAPDGHVAVAVISDLEAAAPRRLEVWNLAGAKPSLAFSVPAKDEDDTIYELVAWVDATHLRLKRGAWGSDRRTQVMLVQDEAGWHIEVGDL